MMKYTYKLYGCNAFFYVLKRDDLILTINAWSQEVPVGVNQWTFGGSDAWLQKSFLIGNADA